MKNDQQGMTLIVKTITRLTVGLILIYAIYIVLQGHLSPGGGFDGGVIIALSFIHLMLAFGKEKVLTTINQKRGLLLSSIGLAFFLFLARIGFMNDRLGQIGAGHFKLFGAGLVPLYEVSIALMVGAGLFTVFLALSLFSGENQR